MAESNTILEATTRHQIWLQRLASHYAYSFDPVLLKADKIIRDVLSKYPGQIPNVRIRNEIIAELTKGLGITYSGWIGDLSDNMIELAEAEADFTVNNIGTFSTQKPITPAVEQILAAARVVPIQLNDKGESVLYGAMLKAFTPNQVNRVNSIVRLGFVRGMTTAEMAQAIRGTKALNFKDGVLNTTKNNAYTMARTATGHVANTAKQISYKKNSDILKGWEFVATLDSRTTNQCRHFDNQEFKIGQGPIPPLHVNACASGTMITTGHGIKKIEDVVVGDKALTHSGKFERVYCVMTKPIDQKMYELKNNIGETVRLTHDHPVLTLNGWKRCGDLKAGDKVLNSTKNLRVSKHWFFGAKVKQQVLINSHNIKTSLTESLVSYKVFSVTAGVSSSIKLNKGLADSKIANILKNLKLKIIRVANFVKNIYH